ncbi:MAG: Rrf2 family transcriptional regulator [Chloroflexi bacterium]|nr:Rrf2 family transcriptional regulator [Chloroflexota bacterium]
MSTRGRYTTKAIVDLALNYCEGPVYLKDIASRQGLSQRYLSQLVLPLIEAGLVKSIRGRNGGFLLAKAPADITLAEIIRVSEGKIVFEDCVEKPDVCNKSNTCILHDFWTETTEAIDNVLESTSLQDLVDRQARKKEATC